MAAQKKATPAKVTAKNGFVLDEYHSRLVMFFFLAVALFCLAFVLIKTQGI